MKTEVFKHSRLARTPPSTFLFLHLHLSNSPGSENPSPFLGSSDALLSTANDNRLVSAVDSLIKMRSIEGATACLGLGGQCSAALSGWVIGPPNRRCQRPLSTNRRTALRILQCAEVFDFWGLRPYLSHNPATF